MILLFGLMSKLWATTHLQLPYFKFQGWYPTHSALIQLIQEQGTTSVFGFNSKFFLSILTLQGNLRVPLQGPPLFREIFIFTKPQVARWWYEGCRHLMQTSGKAAVKKMPAPTYTCIWQFRSPEQHWHRNGHHRAEPRYTHVSWRNRECRSPI